MSSAVQREFIKLRAKTAKVTYSITITNIFLVPQVSDSQPPMTTVTMLVPIIAEVMRPTWALVSPSSSLMNG